MVPAAPTFLCPPGIAIRTAGPVERRRAADLVTVAFLFGAPPLTAENQAALTRAIIDGYKDEKRATAFVAWSGSAMVGAVLCVCEGVERAGFPAGWTMLRALGVAGDANGRGVGAALTLRVVSHAMTMAAAGVGLYTAEDNLRAKRLYERLGFIAISSVFTLYGLAYRRHGLGRVGAEALLTNHEDANHANRSH